MLTIMSTTPSPHHHPHPHQSTTSWLPHHRSSHSWAAHSWSSSSQAQNHHSWRFGSQHVSARFKVRVHHSQWRLLKAKFTRKNLGGGRATPNFFWVDHFWLQCKWNVILWCNQFSLWTLVVTSNWILRVSLVSKLRQHKMKNALLTIWRTTFSHLSFLLTAVLAFDLCLSYALTFSVAVCLSYALTFSVEVLGPKTLHVTEVGGMIPDPCFGGNTADLSLPKLSPPDKRQFSGCFRIQVVRFHDLQMLGVLIMFARPLSKQNILTPSLWSSKEVCNPESSGTGSVPGAQLDHCTQSFFVQ